MLRTCGNNRLITASLPVSDSHCDHGYLLYGDFCYKFVTESVSNWNDAEAQCQRDQAHLASFHSEEELSFITGEQPGKTRKVSKRHPFKKKKRVATFPSICSSPASSSLDRTERHQQWKSFRLHGRNPCGKPFKICSGVCVEDTLSVLAVSVLPQDFLPWAPNQPDDWQNNEDCVQIRGMDHHEAGKLNDDVCTSTKEFICKKGLMEL